jgi:hypothetical protein
MKKSILVTLSILVVISNIFGISPPEKVKKGLTEKFPAATKITWRKESAKIWEVKFLIDGKIFSCDFDPNGKWLETEIKIDIADLPKPVTEAIKSTYSNATITACYKTETLKNGIYYEADIIKGKKNKEVAFNADGSPVIK